MKKVRAMDKYRITNESMEYNGFVLWRIECLKTRRKGGWIQSEMNLSQSGESWVGDDAKVYGEATIIDNAKVSGNAEVFGAARIAADAQVYGNAVVSDYAIVSAYAQVYDEALIEDSAQVFGNATVSGKAMVSAYAKVYEDATIEGSAQVYDNAHVCGHAKITDRAYLYKEAHIKGYTVVSNNERISNHIYNWEDVNALSQLKISMADGSGKGELFANGRHQIALKITLVAHDRKNNPIEISPKEIANNLEFIDEENNLLDENFHFSIKKGLYVCPEVEANSIVNEKNYSSVIVYCAINVAVKMVKIGVRCQIKQWSKFNGMEKIKRVEYATSIENNNSSIKASYVVVDVQPKRQFKQSNIVVQTLTENDVNGIPNSKLTQYYVKFNPEDGLKLRQSLCINQKWFHYKQIGIYKRCTASTDGLFTQDVHTVFSTKFEFTSSKFRKVVSKNHQIDGLCFWVYQLWEGLIWSYYEWGGEMYFSLFDQYGNEASITAKAGEDDQLHFSVHTEELYCD